MSKKQDALDYHSTGRKGKIEVIPSKPCLTQRDLSLAYSPGVAEPCLEIEKNPEDAYKYTAKGNLVAVLSNGTAVLGLGDIGALAGKPVMEGKGVLFKRFADIDVFDIEVDTKNADEIIKVCQLLEPTFGGINLEDIKAPECFYIEEKLKETMNIPVFHDDQHGTAIISGAALINALELVGKKIEDIKIVVNGAGASGIACAQMAVELGAKKENIILCDTKGVIFKGRSAGMNEYKERFAVETEDRTLEDAFKNADVAYGLSSKGAFTPEMIRDMAPNPIIFAMANPDPEITPEEVAAVRADAIMATGRSDYPNQVNNVLGFPFIFRGALDVRATTINETMKKACVFALAELAKEDCPDSVCRAYGNKKFAFGREYIIPKPFDPRALLRVAPAVAKAAMESGVARQPIADMEKYMEHLETLQGKAKETLRLIINKAKTDPKRVVLPEGENEKILRAAQVMIEEGIAYPILLGNRQEIRKKIEELNLDLNGGVTIIDPDDSPDTERYSQALFEQRQRKGITLTEARRMIRRRGRTYFGCEMVRCGDADALLSGIDAHYPDIIRPALEVIGKQEGLSSVHGLYLMVFKRGIFLLADTTVCIEPTAEELAETAILAAEKARLLDLDPRIAMLSFSNFGSVNHPQALKVKRAAEIVKQRAPELIIDGEMQADTAVVPDILESHYPFATLKGGANILIFPDLNSGNISYKLLTRLGGADAIGPILMGMKKPVHVLQRGDDVMDIVNMAAIAVVDAQSN
ncbi:NADP-dependent malic enzyme [Geobacter sulfurreducens]|uniref:Malate oxidoreductase, NADP-dependent, phosphate acetyltransferase-like domain-containing n=1 Tax=Geobacter sulfurreducens (strain ATCC 51573 / DSM 12127 / PCA) TaxID=243231 RepID=Q74CH3_GEOSL|nr:NADP-dependent malic enzyme [Geobacter sulfurreducens]AAR35078.1 malate oxidoreductase, NADP-dependent, phosphate acetyltransferase-like domain-containing [Geobacter sulfurreducens PCA]ADI84536.1 malate oxidoreductase, NADP-dependent, phosphate acetyltransferase-like domain-containing [Geobacter sulfurreducens KN400]QVW36856.1 NADP-dependent malic enzyme [Geobacter sulfurreducens]UAC05695.1 NADP-dependent malic enzyme [Geobacter sulfurreducens]UTG94329.1 NADP-dependent malic enzyme [Geobact